MWNKVIISVLLFATGWNTSVWAQHRAVAGSHDAIRAKRVSETVDDRWAAAFDSLVTVYKD